MHLFSKPYLRITDLQNNSVNWQTVPFCQCDEVEKYGLKKGDIVIARTGATTGKSFLLKELPEAAVFASYLIRLHTSNAFPPEYLGWFMQSFDYWQQITEVSKGTAQPGANASILSKLIVPLPPLNEQRRIVSTIEQLTDRSHKARAALADVPKLIAQFRQSVLAAAFRGDLTADWRKKNPDVEPASELLERIKIDRRKRWEEAELKKMRAKGKEPKDNKWKERYKETIEPNDSELRELPKIWCWTTLDQIMKKIVDGTHHTPTYIDSGTPFLSVKDIRNEEIYFDNCKYISEEEHNCLIERCNPEVGDLLVTKSGTIGRCAIIKTSEPFSLFVSVALLKPATSYLNIEYISLAFQCKDSGQKC